MVIVGYSTDLLADLRAGFTTRELKPRRSLEISVSGTFGTSTITWRGKKSPDESCDRFTDSNLDDQPFDIGLNRTTI